jgi:hypothetical protein
VRRKWEVLGGCSCGPADACSDARWHRLVDGVALAGAGGGAGEQVAGGLVDSGCAEQHRRFGDLKAAQDEFRLARFPR